MKKYKVLLLASYCHEEDGCTEEKPCAECLQMCNVYEVPQGEIDIQKNYIRQFDQTN